MKICLMTEWMSNPIGSILDLIDINARDLINRGAAYLIDKESLSKELLYENKTFDAPPKDKIMRRNLIK